MMCPICQGARAGVQPRATFVVFGGMRMHGDSDMAKLTYGKTLPTFDNFSQFDGDTLKLTTLTGDACTLKDKDGTSMVLKGDNFERTESVITGGTITSAEFFNAKGDLIYTFENLSADAEAVYKAFTLDKDPLRILHGLMEGNDTVAGSAKNDSLWGFAGDDILRGRYGNDSLYGHRGNDMLTGGQGVDTFVFLTGYDHDTVTDFERSATAHDLIRMDYYLFDDIVYSEAAGSVTLTLPSGDSLTLLNVTQAQIAGNTEYFDFF
jgi:Ca2+-binding RTX toxin-like protein